MPNRRILACLALAGCLVATGRTAQAQNPVITVTVDEDGKGVILSPTIFPGVTFPTVGTLASDPGPGGLPLALTYSLLGPPSLVAGDLLLTEPGGSASLSDLIRFNPAGTGGNPKYPASLVFYSDFATGSDNLADVGFPTDMYANRLTFLETGPENGLNGFFNYTPTAGQPGFIAGFDTTYNFISGRAVPEPGSLVMLGTGLASVGVVVWRKRRRVTSPTG